MKIAEDEARDKMHRREGTAVALRLKQATTTDVEEYFPVFLEMVRNLLDGALRICRHSFRYLLSFRTLND